MPEYSTHKHNHNFQRTTHSDGSTSYRCLHCGIVRLQRPERAEMAESPEELRVKMQQAREELAADLEQLRG